MKTETGIARTGRAGDIVSNEVTKCVGTELGLTLGAVDGIEEDDRDGTLLGEVEGA